MNQILDIILMADQKAGQGNPLFSGLLPILLIIVVFYFFMIRPQMKKQKEQSKFRNEIKKGDRIITIGGIHGKIIEISEKTFMIEVEGGNKLKIEKSGVSLENTLAANKKEKES